MLTIKRAAEAVGVSESTLRAWERRHGVDVARRTAAGYRVYDDEAVRLLRRMHQLVLDGWPVAEAAGEVRRGAVPDSPTALGDHEALVRVAETYDTDALTAVLDDVLATRSFEAAVDGWLLPSLRSLGSAWADGRVGVAGEHLVANGVGRRLAAAYDAAGRGGGPSVVLGLPPGSRHDLGLLAFATAVRRAGLATLYLGADVPVDDWVRATASRPVAAAVLAVPTTDDVPAAEATVAALTEHAPGLLIAVGGGAQDLAPASCLRLGHEVGPAAATLASRVWAVA